ncbi:DASH complex subunit ask1 [Coemansia aciculifera]|uniref:DASH complex subunit ASK1 n=1 Tax=Coemansia aciculifera TaxID=417176 RepID=A0A9W8IKV9_9FUNG|nr:DASH complex subunit ask1 [Coemansia aciculifera]KAJ2872897.1 DASH complex subunit ask1 [Coemansia aciculifera]
MSNFGRQQHILRPESRAGQSTGGGRFTHALSAAIKREDYSRPPLPPTVSMGNHQPEEQLEEVEQKITLALQAIDANFDHCQRTMARDVMPKVERLAKLSSELLQASQPWLQFFMAVAAADDNEEGEAVQGLEDDEETKRGPIGVAQRVAIEEQLHKGDITARFPGEAEGMGRRQLEAWNNAGGAEDEDEPVDIDTEIATPQLTSRFMTQEIGFTTTSAKPDATPTTPRVRTLKRSAEMFSVSAKKRKLGTPAKSTSQQAGSGAGPSTPLSMMRALVHAKGRVGGGVGFRGMPGSGASYASKNSSSMDTDDLMPNTSPPITTTFTLPKSRRIAAAHGPKGKTPLAGSHGFGEEDDDDDILGEINSLIQRYDSPKRPGSVAASTVMGSTGMMSAARSEVSSSSIGGMSALVNKYASPTEVAVKAEEAKRIQGLVADMEEMLGEVEAMDRGGDSVEDDGDLETTGRVFAATATAAAAAAQSESTQEAEVAEADNEEVDDFNDDIPSPPRITSDINGAGVVVDEIPLNTVAAVTEAPVAAVVARGLNPARRTFGGGGIARNMLHMDVEAMDSEDMTVGHLSPLGNRGRIAAGVRPLQPPQVSGQRFHALAEHDEDDPFGPTPERRRPTAVSRSSRYNDAPISAQSERTTGAVNSDAPHSTRSWGGSAAVRSMQSSVTALGSEPTGTYDSSRLLHGGAGDLDTHTHDSAQLNESSLEFDGTTSILPTREMLQHAAAQAAGSSSAMIHDDEDDTRNSVVDSPGSSYSESMPLELRSFDVELFPPAFRAAPAALQLRGLYDLIRSQDQRIWALDDLVAELTAPTVSDELRGAGAGVLVVLLDLLARRRLVRKVDDGLWSAH